MALLSAFNRSQGTTLIVVTHNHDVARATRRIVALRDGRIQSDTAVSDPFASDLIDFKGSPLGQAILNDDGVREAAPALRKALEKL